IFNHRNFWDGRAQADFNGVNPFGSRDPNARVLQADPITGMPHLVQISLTSGASLASLATGPPLSAFEMSAEGRTLRKLRKKLLPLRPLARQLVAPDDSALGPLSNFFVNPRLRGLNTTYTELIRAAFRPEWWRSETIVTYDANGTPAFRDRMANPTLTTNE